MFCSLFFAPPFQLLQLSLSAPTFFGAPFSVYGTRRCTCCSRDDCKKLAPKRLEVSEAAWEKREKLTNHLPLSFATHAPRHSWQCKPRRSVILKVTLQVYLPLLRSTVTGERRGYGKATGDEADCCHCQAAVEFTVHPRRVALEHLKNKIWNFRIPPSPTIGQWLLVAVAAATISISPDSCPI